MNIPNHVAILDLNVGENIYVFSPSFPSFIPINRWFWCSPRNTISQSSPSFFKLSSLSYFFLLLSGLNTLSRVLAC